MKTWQRTALQLGSVALGLAAFAATASGYYHFVHYGSKSGPFVPIPEKFDLAALDRNTVYYYVSSTGPEKMYETDSFAAVLTQLRLAASAWNNVDSSALRVAYGGLFAKDTQQGTPHVEITFDELPPGLLAMGGPTARADVAQGPDGQFVPILRSVLVLSQDLSERPSYVMPFFLTAVHELGHGLGLQHTFTSSVMSVEVTRASTKAAPLGADDIAAISLLYPKPGYATSTGSISGRVAISDAGVSLASVVALTPSGQAVSALTNPDGTFRIDGLRPAQYLVYAHTLPPAAQSDLGAGDIVLPLDPDAHPIPAGASFRTQFYPGTYDPHEAAYVNVTAGNTATDVNFAVAAQGAPTLYDVTTWAFPGALAINPAFLNLNQPARPFAVAWGEGLMDGTAVRPGLTVSMIGGNASQIAPDGVKPYFKDPRYMELDFLVTPFSGRGPRHLVFSAGDELYVLPSGVTLVARKPPSITSVTGGVDPQGNATVAVQGTDFGPDTRIIFDGAVVPVIGRDLANGTLTVTPPPAAKGYQARVVAMNADGQSSGFTQVPPLFRYDSGSTDTPSLTLGPNALPAGSESMIDITAANMTFVPGQVQVGLGSSDVVVKNVWVVSPTLARANVSVMPNAQPADTLVSVMSGFQTVSLPGGFHIQAAVTAPVLGSDVRNADPAQTGIYPGATAIVPVRNLSANDTAGAVTLTLNDRTVAVLALEGGTLTFQIPADMPAAPAVLRLNTPEGTTRPVLIVIDSAPPAISTVIDGEEAVSADHPARLGDDLSVVVSHLGTDGAETDPAAVKLVIGGIEHPILGAIAAVEGRPELHSVKTILSPLLKAGTQVPVTVTIDGRTSLPFTLPIAGNPEGSS